MYGDIIEGDFESFLRNFTKLEKPPTAFYIESQGGNLIEAMKIGSFIKGSQIEVRTGDYCYSACVFIFAAASKRLALGELGLHRPYFDKKYFAELNAIEAKKKYEVRLCEPNYALSY